MEVFYLCIVYSLFATPAYAAPTTTTQSAAATATARSPSFMMEPSGRGTVGLLTACVVTFSLCVWTAIHPNIIPNPTGWRQVRYKMFWTAVCVGLPEAIVLCAYGQWLEAKAIRKVWISTHGKEHDIGIAGGFFVVMGGIVVGELGENGRYDTTLTCDGFKKYVREHRITAKHFQQRAASDRGRAGVLVKVLVFGQAGWFVVGCFARVFKHLPATLLEIHVVIQVLYVFAAYGFWFYKPLDVNEPIHIVLDPPKPGLSTIETDPKFSAAEIDPELPDHDIYPQLPVPEIYPDDPKTTLEDSLYRHPRRPLPHPPTPPGGPEWIPAWLAARAQAELKPIRLTVTERVRDGAVVLGLRAFYDIGEHIGHGKTTLAAAFLTGLNGVFHAGAWNSLFPSLVEAWLWRGASLSVCFVPFVLALLFHYGDYRTYTAPTLWQSRFTDEEGFRGQMGEFLSNGRAGLASIAWRRHDSAEDGQQHKVGLSKSKILKCIITLFLYFYYIFCMTYITLESFISVRSLPQGAYSTPRWASNVPHVS